MEDKKHLARNNYSSSTFLKRSNVNSFQNENNDEFKENFAKMSNSNPCQKYSESQKNNITLSLEQFMENQSKKHLTTKFGHKDVEIFLKEKDKAMEEIIINEEINNENQKNDKNNDIKNNNNSNKSSQNLIFHGTFGKDEYDRIMNKEHHHHHHHHHHHKENLENDSSKKDKEDINKKGNIPLKC